MSEPARQYPNPDPVARPQPGPLRDWLAAMKAATSAQPAEIQQPIQEAAPEPAPGWTPRVVTPPAPPAPKVVEAVEADMSDLMAENLMLKAKLRVETDRYDALQGVLAQELRGLRAHVEDEMRELDDIRAERDELTDAQSRLTQDLRDLRAKLESEAEILNEVRNERDLWMARCEALAQPLFQKR